MLILHIKLELSLCLWSKTLHNAIVVVYSYVPFTNQASKEEKVAFFRRKNRSVLGTQEEIVLVV